MPSKQSIDVYQSKKFSFGSTSAIITNLALIIGLDSVVHAKLAIIGSLLVIAVASAVILASKLLGV